MLGLYRLLITTKPREKEYKYILVYISQISRYLYGIVLANYTTALKPIHGAKLLINSMLVSNHRSIASRAHWLIGSLSFFSPRPAPLLVFIFVLVLRLGGGQIYCTHNLPSWSLPWQRLKQEQSTSSGFVIDGRRLITNAHSVEYSTLIQVCLYFVGALRSCARSIIIILWYGMINVFAFWQMLQRFAVTDSKRDCGDVFPCTRYCTAVGTILCCVFGCVTLWLGYFCKPEKIVKKQR